MSQTCTTLLLFLLPGLLTAQITLTRANLPTVGDNIITQEIDSAWLAGLDLGSTGGGQQWDFSNPQKTTGKPDTTFFIDPAGTAFAANFPDANLAGTPNPADSGAGLEYQRLTSEAFEILGYQDTVIFNKNFGPETRLTFPFDEKSRIDQTFDLFANVIEFQDTGIVEQLTRADAWGQVTTPLGTFDCIRVKRERTETFRVFGLPIRIENTIYEFWTAEFIIPVLVYDHQLSNLFGGEDESLTGQYLTGQNVVTSRRTALSPVQRLRVFPNPVVSQLTLEFELSRQGPLRLVLFNTLGQPVFLQPVTQTTPGNNRFTLALPSLAAGLYQLTLYGEKGTVVSRMIAIERPGEN